MALATDRPMIRAPVPIEAMWIVSIHGPAALYVIIASAFRALKSVGHDISLTQNMPDHIKCTKLINGAVISLLWKLKVNESTHQILTHPCLNVTRKEELTHCLCL
jgi:hypothetical protein